MRRRQFISLLAGAAATWPVAGRAQQQQMPTVGFLGGLSAADRPDLTEALRQGLNDAGYNEGRNVKSNTGTPTIEWTNYKRWQPT